MWIINSNFIKNDTVPFIFILQHVYNKGKYY